MKSLSNLVCVVGAVAGVFFLCMESKNVWEESSPENEEYRFAEVQWTFVGSVETVDGVQVFDSPFALQDWERDLLEENAVEGEVVELWFSPIRLCMSELPLHYDGPGELGDGRMIADERNGIYYNLHYPAVFNHLNDYNWQKTEYRRCR